MFFYAPASMLFVCRRLHRQAGMTDRFKKANCRPPANKKMLISALSVSLRWNPIAVSVPLFHHSMWLPTWMTTKNVIFPTSC